jgi:hypothetical protein
MNTSGADVFNIDRFDEKPINRKGGSDGGTAWACIESLLSCMPDEGHTASESSSPEVDIHTGIHTVLTRKGDPVIIGVGSRD